MDAELKQYLDAMKLELKADTAGQIGVAVELLKADTAGQIGVAVELLKADTAAQIGTAVELIKVHTASQISAAEERLKAYTRQECEKVETTLLTEFHKWASPTELRIRSHATAMRALDLEIEDVKDRLTKLEPPPAAH